MSYVLYNKSPQDFEPSLPVIRIDIMYQCRSTGLERAKYYPLSCMLFLAHLLPFLHSQWCCCFRMS